MSTQGDIRESGYESANADGVALTKGEKLKVQRDQGGSNVRPVDPANGNVASPNAPVPTEKV
jgi:hypothetical protein